jgi:putative mRNA 3-end processing factor
MCDKGTEHVFCVHGDNTVGFAEWITKEIGVKAYAPKLGEEYFI